MWKLVTYWILNFSHRSVTFIGGDAFRCKHHPLGPIIYFINYIYCIYFLSVALSVVCVGVVRIFNKIKLELFILLSLLPFCCSQPRSVKYSLDEHRSEDIERCILRLRFFADRHHSNVSTTLLLVDKFLQLSGRFYPNISYACCGPPPKKRGIIFFTVRLVRRKPTVVDDGGPLLQFI